jgi:hypothetical protein
MIFSEHFTPIAALDLTPIKQKLMVQSGTAWSAEKADAVEAEYRRFLYIMKICPRAEAAPTAVETKRYAQDCERALGFFLHRPANLKITPMAIQRSH